MTHRVHLDYASSAPMREEVREAISQFIRSDSFDPRRLYDEAIISRYRIEENRQKVAELVGCLASEVIFTGSSSESLAMFAYGVIPREEQSFRDAISYSDRFNVVGTPYDSKVIKEIWLRENIDSRIISANQNAQLDLEQLNKIVDSSTLAITLPFAHPDTGTLQDINKAVEIIRSQNSDSLIHVDARIANGNYKFSFDELDIDALTIDPSVFGGPSGVAALILRTGRQLTPLLPGSTQERARRAGLENMIGIEGFGTACEVLQRNIEIEIEQSTKHRSNIVSALKKAGVKIIGEDTPCLPNIVCGYFEGMAASVIVQQLNSHGINIHAGSACGSEEFEPSMELTSVVGNENISESAFRISWGYATTDQDIDLLLSTLSEKRSVL